MKIVSQIIKENYYCQFWFKFAFIPILLMLSCLLLHFEEEQKKKAEAAIEGVLYKESYLLRIFIAKK